LLCKSCVQRCNIFKTNGTQELNQSKQFLCHHRGARSTSSLRSVETRISWSITHGSPCRILHPVPCIQLVHVVFCEAVQPAQDRFHPRSSKSYNWSSENFRDACAHAFSRSHTYQYGVAQARHPFPFRRARAKCSLRVCVSVYVFQYIIRMLMHTHTHTLARVSRHTHTHTHIRAHDYTSGGQQQHTHTHTHAVAVARQ
jgi:hypothetical protein